MNFKLKLFVILWLAGLAGVLSFLAVDLSQLLANIPVAAGTAPLPSPVMLKLVSVIQPAVLVSLAVWVGVALASRVGLTAPVAEAIAANRSVWVAFKPQIVPGLIGCLIGSGLLFLIWMVWKPLLPPEFVTRGLALNALTPLVTRLLYGGFTEELLLRWGVMTLLVWAPWRLFQRGQGEPHAIYMTSAIVISSVVFGVGHLPIAIMLSPVVTVALVSYIVMGNTVFGLIAGYLYWKKGLEAAMLAHMLIHVILVIVGPV